MNEYIHLWKGEAFPGGSDSKDSTCKAGDLGWIPEESMTAHSSILAWRISMDRGAWRATVHGVAKCWKRPGDWTKTRGGNPTERRGQRRARPRGLFRGSWARRLRGRWVWRLPWPWPGFRAPRIRPGRARLGPGEGSRGRPTFWSTSTDWPGAWKGNSRPGACSGQGRLSHGVFPWCAGSEKAPDRRRTTVSERPVPFSSSLAIPSLSWELCLVAADPSQFL